MPHSNYDLVEHLSAMRARIDCVLARELAQYEAHNSPLVAAMRYAVLLGGKRVRPFLIYATGQMLGVALEKLDGSAAAMEAVHAYSLVHDDLPAMDNDTLRRGQPTCHIQYGEDTAILAGDALQTFAFERLAEDPYLSATQKIAQIQALAKAAGARGMCLGQSLDLLAENQAVSLARLEQIHRNKTGALIEASVIMGLNASDYAADCAVRTQLTGYAQAIGLAFQVQDDILDVIGESEVLGKTAGADEALNKSTYPKLLGLDGAQAKAQQLYAEALECLSRLPFDTTALRALATFIIERKN